MKSELVFHYRANIPCFKNIFEKFHNFISWVEITMLSPNIVYESESFKTLGFSNVLNAPKITYILHSVSI